VTGAHARGREQPKIRGTPLLPAHLDTQACYNWFDNRKPKPFQDCQPNTSNVARLGHNVICIDIPLLIVIFLELDSVLFLQSLSTLQKILASSSLTPFAEGTMVSITSSGRVGPTRTTQTRRTFTSRRWTRQRTSARTGCSSTSRRRRGSRAS
jgi:hypothetical protein